MLLHTLNPREGFEMPLPNNGDPDASAPTVMRFGVRKISKGLFATFDFSPPQFGGDPYNPIKLADGCEVLIVSDDKAYNIRVYEGRYRRQRWRC